MDNISFTNFETHGEKYEEEECNKTKEIQDGQGGKEYFLKNRVRQQTNLNTPTLLQQRKYPSCPPSHQKLDIISWRI